MSDNLQSANHQTSGKRLVTWIQEPLGSIIAATVASIGSLGVVLSGIWFVNLALS